MERRSDSTMIPSGVLKETNMEKKISQLRLFPVDESILHDLSVAVMNTFLAHDESISRKNKNMKKQLSAVRGILQNSYCLVPSQLCVVDSLEGLCLSENINYNAVLEILQNESDILLLGEAALISALSKETKNRIIQHILRKPNFKKSDICHNFLCKIWHNRDNVPLSFETVEALMLYFPFCIEEFLLDILEEAAVRCSGDNIHLLLMKQEVQLVFDVCSKSSSAFHVVLSILHQLLLISSANKSVILFISEFVRHIEHLPSDIFFVELFPFEQQALIISMQINPSFYPNEFIVNEFSREYVLKRILEQLLVNRRIGGALLSYFPDWVPFFSDYCKRNNVTSFVASHLKGVNFREEYLQFILNYV